MDCRLEALKLPMDCRLEALKQEFPTGTRVAVDCKGEDSLKFVGTVVGLILTDSWPGKLLIKMESIGDEFTKKTFDLYGYDVIVVPYRSSIYKNDYGVNVKRI